MKQLLQLLALNLFGLNSLQIIAAIGIAVMLLQMVVKRFSPMSEWKAKRRRQKLENDMWAIE